MKNIKDKKIIILVLILVIFTICYFVIVNKVSHAFETDYDLKGAYEQRLETIVKCAESYGKSNLERFNEEGILYITVQNLIEFGCLFPNADGNVENILNNSEILNNKKIRIKNDMGKIKAEIYS